MTGSLTALTFAGAITVQAQTPQTPTTPAGQPQTQRPTTTDTQRPTTDSQRSATTDQAITISGCLKSEKDVPGRGTDIAARVGMDDDYILTNVKMAQGSSTSGMGLAAMYEVKGVSDSELKKHLNHQVEVTGRLDSKSGSA
jgi:hypothetical protein